MKKTLLVILTALLLFTTACSGGDGSGTVTTATVPTTAAAAQTSATAAAEQVIPMTWTVENFSSQISSAYPQDDTYHAETDSPYQLMSANGGHKLAAAENGYYMLVGNFLMFADAETMQTVPVCAKPNCRHNEETDKARAKECYAYFNTFNAEEVFYTNGKLYVFHNSDQTNPRGDNSIAYGQQLTQLSPDGTQRRVILHTELVFPGYCCIHRGRFYVVEQKRSENDISVAELWSYSLDNPGEEPVCLYRTEEKAMTSNIVTRLYAYGTRLYLEEAVEAVGANKRGEACWVNQDLQILDLTSGVWTTFMRPEGYSVGTNMVSGDRLYTFCFSFDSMLAAMEGTSLPEDADPTSVWFSSALDGSGTTMIRQEACALSVSDDDYLYLTEPMTQGYTEHLFIYDRSMDPVDTVEYGGIKEEGASFMVCYLHPVQGEKLLVRCQMGIEDVWYWFDRAEIGSGDIALHEFFRCNSMDYMVTG